MLPYRHRLTLTSALLSTVLITPYAMAQSGIEEDFGDIAPGAPGILNATVEPLAGCQELRDAGSTVSGTYRVSRNGEPATLLYCDMSLRGGGWTVILRRVSDEVEFNRNWVEYKYGFGDLDGDYWMGLENIKDLTDSGDFELHVGFGERFGFSTSAQYGYFSIGDEASAYRLNLDGPAGYSFDSSSTAGDSFRYHNGESFTTFDRDNDSRFVDNCADHFGGGGWWYNNCFDSNLTGIYYPSGFVPNNQQDGIIWDSLFGETISHLQAVIAIRPRASE